MQDEEGAEDEAEEEEDCIDHRDRIANVEQKAAEYVPEIGYQQFKVLMTQHQFNNESAFHYITKKPFLDGPITFQSCYL